MKNANLPIRAIAGIIDFQIPNLLFFYPLMDIASTSLPNLLPKFISTLTFIWFPLALFYPLVVYILLAKTGHTPGKYFSGLFLGTADEQPLSFKAIVFREMIAKQVSAGFFLFGFFSILKDPNHQGWHDHFIDSFVKMKHNYRYLGLAMMTGLAVLQIWLGVIIYRNIVSNTNLIADIQFLVEPLYTLLPTLAPNR